jgi:hypothetical protein
VHWLHQSSIHCWNCVNRSESSVCCRIELSIANQYSLPKVCCLQQICDSLLKLSCLRWISIHCRNCVVCSELTFAAKSVLSVVNLWFTIETELSAANQCSLPKVCVLQRISIRCRSCVVCSKSVIRCWNWVACGELAFTVKSALAATKWHSLPKLRRLQWNSFHCRIVQPTAKQFSLPNCAARGKLVSLPIFYNRPPGHKWLKCL